LYYVDLQRYNALSSKYADAIRDESRRPEERKQFSPDRDPGPSRSGRGLQA
jgi:hypothetical protein